MPSDTPDTLYTIAEMARLTGINVRTIRYYLAQGLLPASGESGPGAHYGEGHLNRLRLTRRLQEQHLPLAEIRRRLAELTDAQAAELLATSEVEEREAPQTSALEYVRSLLGQGPSGNAGAADAAGTTGPVPSPASAPSPAVAQSVAEASVAFAPPAASMPPPASMARRSRAIPIAAFLPGRARPKPETPRAPTPEGSEGLEDVPMAHVSMPRMRDFIEPQSHERSQWERLSLGPNVEIHIRRPLSRIEQRRVERLITIARQVLKEDKP